MEELLAMQRPVTKVREQLRPITLLEKPSSKAGTLFSPPPAKQNSKKRKNVFLKTPEKESLVSPGNTVSATNPREALYHLSFTINPETKNKLERVQTLMSNQGAKSLETVFSVLLETYLDKHCPERRSAQREKRNAKKKSAKPKGTVLEAIAIFQTSTSLHNKHPVPLKRKTLSQVVFSGGFGVGNFFGIAGFYHFSIA